MLKVIIVDDEQFIAQGLQALIDWNAAGYEVAAVLSDGQEALEYIKKLPVDLVITDVMMPKMTGLELLETVRRENLSNADRKSTRLNSSHPLSSRMPSSA